MRMSWSGGAGRKPTRRRKGDPDKLEIAARWRRETTRSLQAIAARVHLGTSKAANPKLHRHTGRRLEAAPGQEHRRFSRKDPDEK